MHRHPLTEARALAWARLLLGALFVVRTTALSNLLPIPLAHVPGPLLGWPGPGFRFAWLGLVLPSWTVAALCVVRTLAAILFTVGAWPRRAGLVAAGAALLVLSQDPFGVYYTLLVLFGGVALLALTDCASELALRPNAATISADRAVARAAPRAPLSQADYGAWLPLAFVASVYMWSGIAKLHASWLDGDVLLALAQDHHLHGPLAHALVTSPLLRHAASWGVPALELGLGPLLLFRTTRRVALGLALGFHAALELSARPDVIGWAMACLLLACAGGLAWRRPHHAA